MMVAVLRRPTRCAARITASHCCVVDLVGADDGAHLVVEDLGRGAGQGAEAGLLEAGEEVGEREAEGGGTLGDFQRREGVDVHAGSASLTAFVIAR